MIFFAFLAGMSFVVACIACAIAIAEHLRSERVEKALLETQARHSVFIRDATANLATIARSNADAWKELRTQDGMIRAVAAASQPPAYPVGQVHIVVPGPGTLQ